MLTGVCAAWQDWEFPEFVSGQGVKLPGVGVTSISWRCKCLSLRIPEWIRDGLEVKISGKWFNYGTTGQAATAPQNPISKRPNHPYCMHPSHKLNM